MVRLKPPSIIVRYISRLFIIRFVIVLAGITALAELLELFANADDIMQEEKHAIAALLHYGLLRLPEILTVMAAPSAGLGALLALGTLVRYHELVSMKAAGVSQLRLIVALLPVACLIAVLEWGVQDRLVPPAIHALRDWGVGDYSDKKTAEDTMRWVRDGGQVITWDAVRGGQSLANIRIFERDESGRLSAETRAERADFQHGRWTLHGITRLAMATNSVTALPDHAWTIGYTPQRFDLVSAPPSELSFRQLVRFATDPSFGNRPVYFYWTWLWGKLATPFGTLLLALLAVPLTQQFQRHSVIVAVLATGLAISFLYLILRGVTISFGENGALPPLVAAWIPVLILLAVGGTLFARHERY